MNDKNPTIVIINGANWIGSKLVETLTSNQGNVIVVDDFNDASMPFVKHYSDNKRFVFVERDKINTLRENFTKIKYFIHLKNDFNAKDDDISSKQFIKETKFIDEVLTIALEKNSAFILVSSIHLHKDFVLRKNFTRTSKNAYTESDLQDYIERTVLEYHHKAGLNARIARLGNVYGPEMDLSKDPLLLQIISDSFYRDDIRIWGDGLEYMYYVFITDAIQGIMRALFTPNTSGEIFSLTNPEEISVLSIVNKILSFQPRAQKIKFLKGDPNSNPLYERAYIPDPNLSEIGWKPVMTFERGLVQLYEYFKNYVAKYGDYDDSDKYKEDLPGANTSVQVDFDNTLNLADSFAQSTFQPESHQFKEFYNKLNADDSPIYNSKAKSVSKNDPHPYLKPPEKKSKRIISNVLTFIWVLALFAFLVVPVTRVSWLVYSLDANTTQFKQKIDANTYSDSLNDVTYEQDLNDSVASIDWLINLTDQKENKSDYDQLLKSYESSIEIYNSIKDDNLKEALFTSKPVDQETLLKLQRLLPGVKQALEEIVVYKDLKLTTNTKANFGVIYEWLQIIQAQILTKTSANSE